MLVCKRLRAMLLQRVTSATLQCNDPLPLQNVPALQRMRHIHKCTTLPWVVARPLASRFSARLRTRAAQAPSTTPEMPGFKQLSARELRTYVKASVSARSRRCSPILNY